MALTLLTTPEKTVQTILSNVAGARSQLPYSFQREDYQLNGIITSTQVTGKAMLQTFGLDFVSEITVGQKVFCSFDSVDIEDGNYTVLAVQLTSGHTYTTIDLDFTATSNGYYNNLNRKNYKVGIEIKDRDTINQLIPIIFKYSPNPEGYLFLDLGSLLTEYQEEVLLSSIEYVMRFQELYDGFVSGWTATPRIQSIYGEKQLLDIGGSNFWEYLLRNGGSEYYETWNTPDMLSGNLVGDGCIGLWSDYNGGLNARIDANGLNECCKIINQWNSNLPAIPIGTKINIEGIVKIQVSAFVTGGDVRMDVSGIRADGTKTLVDNNVIRTVAGDFGFSDTAFNRTITTNEVFVSFGINFFAIAPSVYDLDLAFGSSPEAIYTIKATYTQAKQLTVFENPMIWEGFYRSCNVLQDDNILSRLGDNTIRFISYQVDINKENQIQDAYATRDAIPSIRTEIVTQKDIYFINTEYVRTDWYSVQADLSSILVAEQLFYKSMPICNNPIYIGWINSKGGFEEHLFSYNQAVERTSEVGLLAESVINEDIENVNRTKKRLPNTWTQQIILEADGLKLDQLKGLAEIKQSDYVVVNLDKTGSKEVFVIVNNGYSTIYDTKEELYSFTLQIELPDNFDLFKALEY